MKAQSVLETIGGTPHIRLNRLFPGAEVWIKSERSNPGGSIKDRIGIAMIEAAEADGRLKPGGTIIEPTSGNTGIGLAMAAAVKGYKLILVMPDSMSVERRRLMQAYGASFELTPRAQGMKGSIAKAEELAAALPGAWIPMQFDNPANIAIHAKTTAQEILADFPEGIDALITGVGTGGHITGCAQVLKAKWPRAEGLRGGAHRLPGHLGRRALARTRSRASAPASSRATCMSRCWTASSWSPPATIRPALGHAGGAAGRLPRRHPGGAPEAAGAARPRRARAPRLASSTMPGPAVVGPSRPRRAARAPCRGDWRGAEPPEPARELWAGEALPEQAALLRLRRHCRRQAARMERVAPRRSVLVVPAGTFPRAARAGRLECQPGGGAGGDDALPASRRRWWAPRPMRRPAGREPGADIALHLARHGVTAVEHVTAPTPGRGAAEQGLGAGGGPDGSAPMAIPGCGRWCWAASPGPCCSR